MASPRVTWNRSSAAPGAMYSLIYLASPPRPTLPSPTPPWMRGLSLPDMNLHNPSGTSPSNLLRNTEMFPTATSRPSPSVILIWLREERGRLWETSWEGRREERGRLRETSWGCEGASQDIWKASCLQPARLESLLSGKTSGSEGSEESGATREGRIRWREKGWASRQERPRGLQ